MSKYFNLYVAMYKNRLDWSDGYNYVKVALQGFKVENKIDKKIVKELKEILALDFVDGRNFRDCQYNYNWILKNLLTDEEREELKNMVF